MIDFHLVSTLPSDVVSESKAVSVI